MRKVASQQGGVQGPRWVGTLLAIVCALGPVSAARASEPPGDAQDAQQERAMLRVDTQSISIPSTKRNGPDNRHFALWQKGGRAYFFAQRAHLLPFRSFTGGNVPRLGLIDQENYPLAPLVDQMTDLEAAEENARGWDEVVAVDLVTGDELARTPLSPNGDMGIAGDRMAVDEEHGLLYVLYAHPPRTEGSPGNGLLHHGTDGAGARDVCANPFGVGYSGQGIGSCVAGVHIFDAATLERRASVSFANVQAGGGASVLAPLALALQASDGKARVLIVDQVNDVTVTGSHAHSTSPHHTMSANLHYLLQVDATSASVDWFVRLEGCRGRRDRSEIDENQQTARLVNPAIIMHTPPDSALYVGCHTGSSRTGVIVRVPLDSDGNVPMLPVALRTPETPEQAAHGTPTSPVQVAPPHQSIYGPDNVLSYLGDPVGGRILLRVIGGKPSAEVWWVFDVARRRFVGTLGLGPATLDGGLPRGISGLDQQTGRLYSLAPHWGLLVAETRSSPLTQPLVFPEFAEIAPKGATAGPDAVIRIWSAGSGRPTRLYFPEWLAEYPQRLRIIEDARPPFAMPPESDEVRTLDLDEAEGVTTAVFDGAARGYGARALLVGGLEAATRVGPLDPLGMATGAALDHPLGGSVLKAFNLPDERRRLFGFVPCTSANRDITLAFVGPEGPAVVDVSEARAQTQPVVTDSALRADSEALLSRCMSAEWEDLWSAALLGRPPVGEPSAPWVLSEAPSTCISSSGKRADSFSDPVAGKLASSVQCDDEQASGWAQVRAFELDGMEVAQALSSFRIYRDPKRGIVARIESAARGVGIAPLFRIDTVRAVAESWANGRRQPVPEAERQADYDPNCDFERTAGTCYQRHIFGVRTPNYSCGPCGDEHALITGLNRASGAYGSFELRGPDPELARGAESGFQAAIAKPQEERFTDMVLNNDLVQTVVPALEFIRYTPPNRVFVGRGGTRGRQIYQFAGVEASSSYSISCVLVYDPATNVCAAETEPAASLAVTLTDASGRPLAGGAFEVRTDSDQDGVAGLMDSLVPDGACLTSDDGIGSCRFDALPPDSYLVTQIAAPHGHARVDEPFLVQLAAGEAHTVTFTNVVDTATVEVTLHDPDGKPLPGVDFDVYADEDADGKVAPGARPAASCRTLADGTCVMRVAVGPYVLVQRGTPEGLAPMEPISLALTAAGQTATVSVVNYPPPSVSAPPTTPRASVDYDTSAPPPPVQTVEEHEPAEAPTAEPMGGPSIVGGTITRVISAPGDVLRLWSRQPMQAIAWTMTLMLAVAAAGTVRRRSLLATLAVAGPGLMRSVPPAPVRFSTTGRLHRGAAGATSGHGAQRVVAGGAPISLERCSPQVVVVTEDPVLAAAASERLSASRHCSLIAVLDSLEALRHGPPRVDVLVVDLALTAHENSFEELRRCHPVERTVGLIPSGSSTRALVQRGYEIGLASMLAADDLTNGHLDYAVRCVAAGKMYFGSTVQTILHQRRSPVRRRLANRGLTARELEVARLAAQGASRSEIATALFVTPMTVKSQLRSIRAKLGVTDPSDRAQLVQRLAERGLLDQ